MNHPAIIQGGMGIAVSNWQLAREVSRLGMLGVVSGTSINSVVVRKLQDGDQDGSIRRALSHFPDQTIAQDIIKEYFIPEGRPSGKPYKRCAMFTVDPSKKLLQLTVASAFCEVFLAKEGHNGLVGMNLLEKIQTPNLANLYGAILAGVDYVLMGAGIPREIPGALDQLSQHEPASLKAHVEDAGPDDVYQIRFVPKEVVNLASWAPMKRPYFLAIVSSATLAINLAKKATGRVDGFVVENYTAGGHNAPPRGPMKLSELGEPIYGAKDEVDFPKLVELGLPFWIAGSYASCERLSHAWQLGATGIQIGTAFAFASESGMSPALKTKVLQRVSQGTETKVFTDPLASPSGFPFKVVKLSGTLGDDELAPKRPRKCDLGYLRSTYKKDDGSLGYRCAAEPLETYVKRGGKIEDTVGRKCLCNGLFATIGMGQHQENGYVEEPIVTAGDALANLAKYVKNGKTSYSARDVIRDLLPAFEAASRLHDAKALNQEPDSAPS